MADKGTTEPQNLWEGSPNPDPWTAAAHNELKEEDGHWEYMVRKSQNEGKGTFGRRARARLIVNSAPHSLTHSLTRSLEGDAAYNNLDYKPVSVMMPVPKKDDNPYWGWFKKGTH